jgi:hypothetical protein
VLARLATIVLLAAALPLNVAAVDRLTSRAPRTVSPLLATAGLALLAPPPTTTTAPPLQAGPPAAAPSGIPVATPGSCPNVAVTVVTDHPSYLLGQPVLATAALVNQSPAACAWPGTVSFTWTDAAGDAVQDGYTDAEPPSVRWAPRQQRIQTESWAQRFGDGSAAAPGPAVVTVVWTDGTGATYTAQAAFEIIDPSTTTVPAPAP